MLAVFLPQKDTFVNAQHTITNSKGFFVVENSGLNASFKDF